VKRPEPMMERVEEGDLAKRDTLSFGNIRNSLGSGIGAHYVFNVICVGV